MNAEEFSPSTLWKPGVDAVGDSEHRGYIVLHDVLIRHVTSLAALCEIDGENQWIPLSMILDETAEADNHNLQDIEVKEWFCRKEEIV